MPTKYQVVYTPTFKTTLARLYFFLTHNYSEELANTTRQEIRTIISEKIVSNPFIGAMSDRLLSIGIKQYRQILVAQHNLIFYKIDKEKVIILAVMDTRQSVSDVLYNALLQY